MPKADDFDMFYAMTSRRLVGQIFAMTGDLSEAEDAVQEAYIRAWRRWPRIRAYDDPEGWLRVVAYRITVNSWRKARNRLTAHRAGRPAEVPGLSPDLVALVSALRKIPEEQRRFLGRGRPGGGDRARSGGAVGTGEGAAGPRPQGAPAVRLRVRRPGTARQGNPPEH